jgi:hypothetical protein
MTREIRSQLWFLRIFRYELVSLLVGLVLLGSCQPALIALRLDYLPYAFADADPCHGGHYGAVR